MKEFVFIVDKELNNIKAKDFLLYKKLSNEIIAKIKFGGVFVNGKVLTNINERVKAFDEIQIKLPKDEVNPFIEKVNGNLQVLYEDEYFLAVFKESGVLTHSSKSNQATSLEQLVLGYINAPFTFRAINRLDKDTSGIVLIALDMVSACFLNQQMKERLIKKSYYAVVKGEVKENHFFIEKPIKRQDENSMKRVCDDSGQYAKTECKIIKKLADGNTLLEVTLHTGRTHQIRVHLASIGYPLYADQLYGEKVDGKKYFLCAKKIEFTHPFSNEKIEISVEDKIIQKLK